MSNGPQRGQYAPTSKIVEENGESILDQVLKATEARRYSIEDMEVISKKAAASRMFGGGDDGASPMTPDQAFMMCMIAEATGIHPALALLRYDIVMGKPAMKSAFVLAEFQRLGGNVEWIKTTEEEVEATFTSKRHPKPFKVAITLQQLKDRKIAVKYDKESKGYKLKHMYANHPRSMLRWRAAVEAIRATDPGIFMGMYADVEAEDVAAALPSEAETDARSSLVEKMAARREPVKENHPPVAETVQELRAAAQPAMVSAPVGEPTRNHAGAAVTAELKPAKPQETQREPAALREASTEWGKWIAEAVADFNQELEKVADDHPDNLKLRTALKPQQVINAVLTAAIKMEMIAEQSILGEKGKRDNARMAAAMTELWDNEVEFIPRAVGDYLAGKMIELLPKEAAAATQGELA